MSSAVEANGEGRVMTLQWTSARAIGAVETFRLKGLLLTDRTFAVPLDYSGRLAGEIEIFVREVVHSGAHEARASLPVLLYLQGGPGFEAPRLTEAGEFARKLARDHRLLLLDQRGTGLSTPADAGALADMPVAARVAYARCFRADSIVRDAELIRRALLGAARRWALLGQSFGGFCCLTYLSLFPWALERVLVCGGLPPLTRGCSAGEVYRSLAPRVIRQMDRYYATFPGDERILRALVLHIAGMPDSCVQLPSGSVLSVRGLQAIGMSCLGQAGSFARLHYLIERAWVSNRVTGERILSRYFLSTVDDMLRFDANPLYVVLHEACYCNAGAESSAWAAERIIRDEFPQFDALKVARAGGRVYLTGEMLFPFMLDELAALRPWKDTALAVAHVADWPVLYCEDTLRANTIPTAAVAYYNDSMVDFDLSMQTANTVGNLHVWITNEYTHAGLREGSDRVVDMLNNMLVGKVTLER